MKVLIIDDEELITRSLSLVFKKRNYDVRIANSAVQGVATWREFRPELVLLDYMMPDHNADWVLSQIPKSSATKVVLMSAYTGEGLLDQSVLDQVNIFIKKPFDDVFKICDQAEGLL